MCYRMYLKAIVHAHTASDACTTLELMSKESTFLDAMMTISELETKEQMEAVAATLEA